MTIHRRLTLWFAGILLVSLVVLIGVVHYEMSEQLRHLSSNQKPHPLWEEIGEVVAYYGVPTALLLLFGGSWLLRQSLAPVTGLTCAVERIHVHNLKERLPRTGNGDELDRLTEVFNSMMARLDHSVAHIREFTLHASHELKTPLAVMRGELETALREASLTSCERERSASLLDEVERLTHIVDCLTLLCKADAGLLQLVREPVPLDDLVRDADTDAQILAQPKQVSVHLEACETAVISGDRRRLRQLLLILSDNAIKYSQEQGTVTFNLRNQDGCACLKVTNTGPGIPPEKLPRVFDRFFRGDESHNKEVEGCGLGLSIAQWIIKAHEGELRIASEPNKLTTVTVLLPLEGQSRLKLSE